MIFPVVLISATFFISTSLGSEEACYLTEEQEDECASVCYPIVKPLLRYFEKCQGKEAQISQLQKEYLDLQKKYSDLQESQSKVLRQLNDYNVIYERWQSKNLEVGHLEAQISTKNQVIELLKNQISGLKEKSELKNNLENSKSNTEEKLAENTNSDNKKEKGEVKTGEVSAEQQNNSRNQKSRTPTQAFPDICPRSQKEEWVVKEIRIPGSDPLKVACVSNERIGTGWMLVYDKQCQSYMFNRTYGEYAAGFGEVGKYFYYSDFFFFGLDKLHHLTNENRHEISLWDGEFKCDNFVIGNRSEGYVVKDTGDCYGKPHLSLKRGTKFSTYDRVEDDYPYPNFAKKLGFGWWFDSTTDPNLLCISVTMHIRRKN